MVRFVSLITLLTASPGALLLGQDSVPHDSTTTSTTVAPAPPTPEQLRYIDGLRSVARGVAQLRDGIDRVARTQQSRDSVRQRLAGRRLGGLCQTARSFIVAGRPRMQPSAYADSMRVLARQLTVRVDSVLKGLPPCEQTAGKTPAPVAADLLNRLRAYEGALAAFRAALSPPKPDSGKT